MRNVKGNSAGQKGISLTETEQKAAKSQIRALGCASGSLENNSWELLKEILTLNYIKIAQTVLSSYFVFIKKAFLVCLAGRKTPKAHLM